MWISSEGVLSDSIRFQESTLQEETLRLDNLAACAKSANARQREQLGIAGDQSLPDVWPP